MLFLVAVVPPALPAASPPAVRASFGACVRPNVPAFIVRGEPPVTPPEALRQEIQGKVDVAVSLDALSHVTAVRIASTPSALLNSAALEAARHSAFQTAIRDCQPIAGDYIYSVDFADDPEAGNVPSAPAFYDTTNPPTAVVSATGRTSYPVAAVAELHLEFVGRGSDQHGAVVAEGAGYVTFNAGLRHMGILQAPATWYYHVFGPTSSSGAYVARHGVRMMIGTDRLAETLRLAAQDGATSARIRYGDATPKASIAEAVAAAMPDAAAQARQVAAEHGLRLGDVVRTFITYVSRQAGVSVALDAPAGRIAVPPPPRAVELRVRVAVTYALHP